MDILQVLHLGEEFNAPSVELLSCGVGAHIEDTRLVTIRGSCHSSQEQRAILPVKRGGERVMRI